MSLVDRYCYYQFFIMLMIGTTIPGGVYLLTEEVQRLLRYVAEAGCPLDLLITMTALQIPATVVTCLPAGVLMATILTLYFMNAESELLALRTAGISLMRVFRPFILIGILCSLISFYIAEEVVPHSLKLSNHIAIVAINNRELPSCKGIHDYVGYEQEPSGRMKTIFLVASRNGRRLYDNIIIDLAANDHIRLIWAPVGLFKNQNWNLFNGQIYDLFANRDESILHQSFGTFYIGPPDLSRFDPSKREARPYEMNSHTLKAEIEKLQKSGRKVPADTYLELYRRYLDPLACLFLVVAALPAALVDRRKKSMLALFYGGAMLVFYFILRSLVAGLAGAGALDPLVAAALPGACLLLIGATLLIVGRRGL